MAPWAIIAWRVKDTPSWGGYHLTEEFEHPGLVPIHQLTIQMVDG